MTTEQQLLNLLGIAQRAGKLVTGEPMVLAAIKDQSLALLWLASDMGASSSKKLSDKAHFYGIPLSTAFTVAELSQATGRQRFAIGVNDAGFAKKMQSLLENLK
ncbi:YlxQ-related RNA-binding protein [Furfurilactobacillus sp. WILCCON 0119]|uniref:YlxQ-related RNA-binding protein n=1 Tax=Furfurilactobacillus entadae TaxID=2922307 RepID=UPI0035E7E086